VCIHPAFLIFNVKLRCYFKMRNLIYFNLLSIFRDKVFHGILSVSVIFLVIPSISSLSMRQATELSITLSLSLTSVLLLLLSVSLGSTTLWKDIERRYSYSVLSLPLSRSKYLLGRFLAVATFMLIITVVLGIVCSGVIHFAAGIYKPDRPVVWVNILLCILFSSFKYIIIVAYAFLFSTFSTSFFLPVFGAISVFLAGSATQQAYDYVHTSAADTLPVMIKYAASFFYYIMPNLTAFDLQVNAVYGIPISLDSILLPMLYLMLYLPIVLLLSVYIFAKREMN